MRSIALSLAPLRRGRAATFRCLSGALALLGLACATRDAPQAARIDAAPGGGAVPWTGLEPHATGPDAFKFLVVTDRTGEHRDGVFEAAIDRINLLQPAFVVSVGDLVEGYTEDPAELDAEWQEFQGFVARLEMPFFYAPGNHDYSNPAMARDWRRRFGPSFYHFRYRDVLFLVLNSELFTSLGDPEHAAAGADSQAAQMDYAKQVLAAHRDARWTFVLIHQPLWDRGHVPEDWLRIEQWLGDRPYTVFGGHYHSYTAQRRNDRRYVTLATTGGASRLRGIDYGEFDHVVLVSVVGKGEPVVANLMLDGIHDVDVRTLDTRDRLNRLGRVVSIEPLLGEGLRFRRGVARFDLANPLDHPIEVEARPAAGRDLVPDPAPRSRRLEPGEEATLEIPLAARSPMRFTELAPASVRFSVRGEKADGAPLVREQTAWLLPEQRFDCPRAAPGTRVDGVLDEWGALPFAVGARPAPPDAPVGASFRFGVAYDDDFLYVAARVTDPSPFHSVGRTAREQDALQIWLDARPAPERDANVDFFRAHSDGSLAKLAITWLAPVETREDPILSRFLAELPAGTRRAVRSVDGGYAVELALPARFLDERQGEAWRELRLNLALQDYAADGGAHVTHWWRPSRFGRSDVMGVPGSGTFTRAE